MAISKKRLSVQEVLFWIKEIESCEAKQRDSLIKRNHYPFLIKYYEGEMNESTDNKDNQKRLAVLNEYFPNINQLINEITYQYPMFTANPTKPEAEAEAPLMQAAITYAMKKLNALEEVKLATFDCLLAGYCAVEVNHINELKTESFIKPQQPGEEKGFIGKIADKIKTALNDDKIEENLEKNISPREMAYATTDETYLRRWNPLNILFDYKAERFKDSRYIIKKIQMPLARFNTMYSDLSGKVKPSYNASYSTHLNEDHAKMVTLYEIQLIENDDTVVNFIINKGYTLSEIDSWARPYTTNRFNIKISTLHDYGVMYPISIAKINKAIQEDINNYMTFQMEVAERNIPKRGYNKQKVKEDGIRSLNSTSINDTVGCDGGPESVWNIPATQVSNDNKETFGLLNQQKEKLWAVTKQRLGQQGNEEFATELQIQEAGFQVNIQGIQGGIKKLWVELADAVKDIIVQFWDKPMWFKITGGDRPSWYEPVLDINGNVSNPLADILKADYEIEVDIMSSMRPNKEKIKRDLLEIANWLVSPQVQMFAEKQGMTVDVSVINKVLREWGWTDETVLKEIAPV